MQIQVQLLAELTNLDAQHLQMEHLN